MRNVDTSLLRTFVTVADTASMTAAANALHLTQGAVSQQIKRLEDLFACALFERERRGLKLTGSGERLVGRAKRLLAMNDEIWAEMTTPDFTGSLRLGVPVDLVSTHAMPVLKHFTQSFPQVEVSLVCEPSPQLMEAAVAGQIDLAIAEQPLDQASGECLAVERLVWVGSKDGEAHRKRPLPVSVVSDACAFRPTMLAALRAQGLEWRALFENGSVEATMAAVKLGLAVTARLGSTVPADLIVLPPEAGLPDLPNFAITLHVPRSGVSAAAREMIGFLRKGMRGPQQPA